MSSENSEKSKIAVVGSGFLGLTLALRLAEAGRRVTVYEAAGEIGGLASAWRLGETIWDRHYHVTLLSDAFTRKIIGEIGLAGEFEWIETKTGFYTGGKLVSMSNTLEFLRFPALDPLSKFRLGATIFYASRVRDWKRLEKIPVAEWLTRLSGVKTFEKMWRPLLKAKLGEAYRETSAAFIWATIQRMYAARNSGLKKEMFGYVRGGYARVLERFAAHLREKGVEIRLNERVEKIEKKNEKLEIYSAGQCREAEIYPRTGSETRGSRAVVGSTAVADRATAGQSIKSAARFDKIILTCPAGAAARIVPQLKEKEKAKLANIRYQGIVCASMLAKKSLSGFYVTNVTDETPFTGIIEMTALVEKSQFGGNALVYLPKYVAPDDELFEKTDAEIEDMFLSALEKMYAHFAREDVVEFKISRVRRVFPLSTICYSDNAPPVETSLENLYIVNSAQITNGTLNVNETIQLAERALERIV